jgi:hypothetical protein
MTRIMYDAVAANARGLVAKNPQMLAIYITGSADIQWTNADVAMFPHVPTWVRIDQAGAGAPNVKATVKDVEPGCYRPENIPHFIFDPSVERPTVYCDRSDLAAVMARWKKDIWLAAPGLSLAECQALRANNKQIVAVQNVFGGTFDSSVVLDDHWPLKAPVVPPPPAADIQADITWQGSAGKTTRHGAIPRSAWDQIKWTPHSPD